MKNHIAAGMVFTLLALGICIPTRAADLQEQQQNIPVAPLQPIEFKGWTNAFLLSNEHLEVIIIPEIGRIMSLTFKGSENMLRLDPYIEGRVPEEASDYWYNFGGNWLWPVSQAFWPDVQNRDWPPSQLLDGRPWTSMAWESSDGTRHCRMTIDTLAPLHIRMTRHFQLAQGKTSLIINQKIERIGESTIPVSLWSISQVQDAELVFLPMGPDSRFENGYKILRFDEPETNTMSPCGNTLTYRTNKGEHKIGTDTTRGWIAIQKDDMLLVEQTQGNYDENAVFPEGGCTVAMYANHSQNYAEIESFGPELLLAKGEKIENQLTITCYKFLPTEKACDSVSQLIKILGEEDIRPTADEPEPAEILEQPISEESSSDLSDLSATSDDS